MIRTKNILGIKICNVDKNELLDILSTIINGNKKNSFVSYYNAHHAVEASYDPEICSYLNSLEMVHSDGLGMYLSSHLLYGSDGLSEKINGTDFYPILLREAERCQWKVYFLGDSQETIDELRKVIFIDYPALKCVGYHNGYFQIDDPEPLNQIKNSSPDILFVGMGLHKQMQWIQQNRESIRSAVRICLMVGGGIGYLAGTRPRAPKIIQFVGFEWFFRLCTNPRYYWHRYLVGIPQFMYLILKQKIKQ